MEKIFSLAWKDKRGIQTDDKEKREGGDAGTLEEDNSNKKIPEEYVDDEQGLQRRHIVDTTLLIHFFGKKGKEELRYEGFRR